MLACFLHNRTIMVRMISPMEHIHLNDETSHPCDHIDVASAAAHLDVSELWLLNKLSNGYFLLCDDICNHHGILPKIHWSEFKRIKEWFHFDKPKMTQPLKNHYW